MLQRPWFNRAPTLPPSHHNTDSANIISNRGTLQPKPFFFFERRDRPSYKKNRPHLKNVPSGLDSTPLRVGSVKVFEKVLF